MLQCIAVGWIVSRATERSKNGPEIVSLLRKSVLNCFQFTRVIFTQIFREPNVIERGVKTNSRITVTLRAGYGYLSKFIAQHCY